MRKTFVVSALAVTLLAGGALGIAAAQGPSTDRPAGASRMEGMPMGGGMTEMMQKTTTGARVTHKGLGVVKKIDTAAGRVTLAHEPVKSLDWPAMTMTFAVRDQMLLGKLAVGSKVEFEFVQDGKGYVVTGVK